MKNLPCAGATIVTVQLPPRSGTSRNRLRTCLTAPFVVQMGVYRLWEDQLSLRIRFRFDGRCSVHPRYNPEKDGRSQHKDCAGCESVWVIHLYPGIARRKAEA